MKFQTIYINKENKATLSCPKCSKAKVIDASQFIPREGQVRISYSFKCTSCDCGSRDCRDCNTGNCNFFNKNTVFLERRAQFRKNVNLPGVIINQRKEEINVLIQDISRTGLKMKMVLKNDIAVHETLIVEFHLNNKQKTFIQKQIIVKKVDNLMIGAEFTSSEEYAGTDKGIGFFLTE